ncbi:MAG: hypothetical protein AAF628_16760 [Planctomycetota bacterium]
MSEPRGRDGPVYAGAAVVVLLVLGAFVAPRFLVEKQRGIDSLADAIGVWMIGLGLAGLAGLILAVHTWRHRLDLSGPARIVGLGTLPALLLGIVILWQWLAA